MDLAARIKAVTGHAPERVRALSGGCVGDVYRITMPAGPDLVAKVGVEGSGLKCEGFMLTYLADHSDFPVPEVIHADDQLLLISLIENDGQLGDSVQINAAQHVTRLHALTTDQGFGFSFDTVIGGLHQPNPWTSSWCDFFRDQRLLFMAGEAARSGRLPTALLERLSRFCADLERWIDQPAQPSLLHGDLWAGNVLSAKGAITGFIDPALYFGDAEIELAFATLFDTFGDAFFNRYQQVRPIKPGFFEHRRDIYNLYPLLVHVRLFGGSYVGTVEQTLKKFGY